MGIFKAVSEPKVKAYLRETD